jgi:hypothetical protein
MAKMPTLNVDVAVNTKTMQKGIAEANKQLQQIGGKGLAAGGGIAAKLGSFGSLGGGLGQAALGVGGVALAAMAPFKAASMITRSYVGAVQDGINALEAWNKSALDGVKTGIGRPIAERLALAESSAAAAAGTQEGFGAAFFGSAMNKEGELGGLVGLGATWAEEFARGAKQATGALGGLLGGKSQEEQQILGMMAAEPENADRLRFMLEGAEKGKTMAYGGVDDPTESMLRARALWKERMQTQELLG